MIIDVHCHLQVPGLAKHLKFEMPSQIFSGMARLPEEQERAGIDLSLVSSPMTMEVYRRESSLTPLEIAQTFHQGVASLVQKNPRRLKAMAITYPFGGDELLKEVEHAIKDMDMVGVAVNPGYDGEYLDSPRAEPLLELMCEMDRPLFIHPPWLSLGADLMKDYRLVEMVGRPFETTLGLARMVLAGTFERFPRLKVVAAHLGGGILMLVGRLNYGYEIRHDASFGPWGEDRLTKPPSEYIKQIHVDTMSFHPPAVQCALSTLGAEHVLFGSDHPPVPIPLERSVETVERLPLSEAEKALVLGGNASRLFRLSRS